MFPSQNSNRLRVSIVRPSSRLVCWRESMVAKISFVPTYNVMLMSRLSSLRHMTRYAYAFVVVRTRLIHSHQLQLVISNPTPILELRSMNSPPSPSAPNITKHFN